MRIHTDTSSFKDISNPVVTIGTFDGLHKGHLTIIERIKEIAKEVGGETVLLTFDPHPRIVLFEDIGLELISSMREKQDLLDDAGLDHLIILPFTHEFSRISAVSYVRDLLVNEIGVHTVVVGYDHHFGRNREGDIESLKEFSELYEFRVEEIPAHAIDDVDVSSTKVRSALKKGDVKRANRYLGYQFRITGSVVEGNRKGRTIGFPTANISVDSEYKLVPLAGVYAVTVLLEEESFGGMMNIGVRPTVEQDSTKETIEVNIFGLEKDIYFKEIVVLLHERIRDEQHFESMEQLKSQLEKDREDANRILSIESRS